MASSSKTSASAGTFTHSEHRWLKLANAPHCAQRQEAPPTGSSQSRLVQGADLGSSARQWTWFRNCVPFVCNFRIALGSRQPNQTPRRTSSSWCWCAYERKLPTKSLERALEFAQHSSRNISSSRFQLESLCKLTRTRTQRESWRKRNYLKFHHILIGAPATNCSF